MYKASFGKKNQVSFNNEHEYYEFLGFLAKSDSKVSIVWERNEEQGAWGSEGRLQFYTNATPFAANVVSTAGTGNIVFRVNCNEFVQHIKDNHAFILGKVQSEVNIRLTIPSEYLSDFERGLRL